MPVEIADWNDLDNVRNDLTGDYVLVNDLDSETDGYAGIGDDWNPIGEREFDGDFYEGIFDGDGFGIRDLIVDDNDSNAALFAGNRGSINDLSVKAEISTSSTDFNAAILTGEARGDLSNCVVHGTVFAPDLTEVAGLAGRCDDAAIISDSYSTASVQGDGQVGGLVGQNGRNNGTVTESYATGSVDGNERVGGLAGRNRDTVTESYATGSVDGNERVGGLAGWNDGTVTESYATGSVEADTDVGGLVGVSLSGSSLDKTYSLSDVTGSDNVGGLYGRGFTTDVSESYAVGNVTGDTNVGGFAGDGGDGDRERNFFDTEATTQSDVFGTSDGAGGVTSLTTAEMQGSEAETNMDGFDFANTWDSVLESDNDATADGYPILLAVDRDQQLDAQGILSLTAFTISALVNSESVEIQDIFAQANDEVREVTEAFALINGSVEQI